MEHSHGFLGASSYKGQTILDQNPNLGWFWVIFWKPKVWGPGTSYHFSTCFPSEMDMKLRCHQGLCRMIPPLGPGGPKVKAVSKLFQRMQQSCRRDEFIGGILYISWWCLWCFYISFDHFKPNPWRLKQQISDQIVGQCGSTKQYSVKNQGANQIKSATSCGYLSNSYGQLTNEDFVCVLAQNVCVNIVIFIIYDIHIYVYSMYI